jgi:hypothetical protein
MTPALLLRALRRCDERYYCLTHCVQGRWYSLAKARQFLGSDDLSSKSDWLGLRLSYRHLSNRIEARWLKMFERYEEEYEWPVSGRIIEE